MENTNTEQKFLKIINNVLSDSSYLGDDCAYLKEFGLYVTHDSLIEDVHFKRSYTSPYNLGKKAVSVNLSDLAAAGAKPLYITLSVSMPNDTDEKFVEDFYMGVNEICEAFGVKVAGGDITGSEKLNISICAIGKKVFDNEVSRSYAKPGDVVFVTGFHGDSSGGLELLLNNKNDCNYLINKHLNPLAQIEKSKEIMNHSSRNFSMMDSSDGLGDALYKIAEESRVTLIIDFDSVPVSNELKKYFPDKWKDFVFWGGEDFELVGAISEQDFAKLDKTHFFKIGRVVDRTAEMPVIVKFDDKELIIDEESFNTNSFNHFEKEKRNGK